MNTLKISDEEIKELCVSSLPTRPTADEGFGGGGLTPEQMKAAFDKLPLYIISRFNALVDSLFADGDSIADAVASGIGTDHTLRDVLSDISSGLFARYLSVNGESLSEKIRKLEGRIEALEGFNPDAGI